MKDRATPGSLGSPVAWLVCLSGALGFLLGLTNATLQVSVETGQVLAGIVTYPAENPFSMYHRAAFSLCNHLSGALLALGVPERSACMIISALLGMISFQALALVLFVINRDRCLSVLGVLFIYLMDRTGNGQVYPTWLLGHPHTYGIAGLSLAVLVVGLLCAGALRSSLFFTGLLPSIHAGWAAWAFVLLGLTGLGERRQAREVAKVGWPYFLAGLALSVAALGYQAALLHGLPACDSEVKRQYLEAYTRYWDQHRRPFFLDVKHGGFQFFQKGVVDALYSVLVSVLALSCFSGERGRRLLFRLLLVAGIAGFLGAALTHIDPAHLPAAVIMLMPGRYLNVNILTVFACFLGVVTCRDHKNFTVPYGAFVLLWLSHGFTRYLPRSLWPVSAVLLCLWVCYLLSVYVSPFAARLERLLGKASTFAARAAGFLRYGRLLWPGRALWRYRLAAAALMGACVVGRAITRKNFLEDRLWKLHLLRDRTNEPFFAAVSERPGMIILGGGEATAMMSLRTRRPTLVPVESGNLVSYVPQAAEPFNRLLRLVYGLHVNVPPGSTYRHRDIHPALYEKLWQSRRLEDWQLLREKTGARDVVTPASWRLSLPVVRKGAGLVLYEIPRKT